MSGWWEGGGDGGQFLDCLTRGELWSGQADGNFNIYNEREERERGGHTHPQELPSLSLITAILGLVVAKQL